MMVKDVLQVVSLHNPSGFSQRAAILNPMTQNALLCFRIFLTYQSSANPNIWGNRTILGGAAGVTHSGVAWGLLRNALGHNPDKSRSPRDQHQQALIRLSLGFSRSCLGVCDPGFGQWWSRRPRGPL